MAEAPRTMRYEAVDDLRPHPRNPKNHDIEELRKSLGRWGYTMPVMVCERTDPETGQRPIVIWRQCPRYPRTGLIAMLRGGCHESARLDAPICAREWR